MQLGQPQPGFANWNKVPVENCLTLVATVHVIRLDIDVVVLVWLTRDWLVVFHRLVGCVTSQDFSV